jgi:hypothetical protein
MTSRPSPGHLSSADAHPFGTYNGMPAALLGELGWERPWSGTNGGQCVEAKRLADGRVAVRQSTDAEGPALIFTRDEFSAFVTGAKGGLVDHLIAD